MVDDIAVEIRSCEQYCCFMLPAKAYIAFDITVEVNSDTW
jgi:hypothetical protein